MIQSLVNLFGPMLFGVVMVVTGMHFKTHIYTKIGQNTNDVHSARGIYRWLCVQAVGPEIFIRIGSADITVIFCMGILSLIFGYDPRKIGMVSCFIGIMLMYAALAFTAQKLGLFNPTWLFDDDTEKKEIWFKTVKEFARNNEHDNLLAFVEADMVQP